MANVLPSPEAPFDGVVSQYAVDSVPSFPRRRGAPEGAPNILLVLLDDVGFGHPGPFGGSVPMPNLQRLADRGLRYTNMHTTAMCSPTRASMLSGRNHHRVANGVITHWATGFPGYHTLWPKSASCVAEVLKQNGYSTAALGKWHNVPQWEEGPHGPFDLWPTNMGFEYFYGFLGSDTNQWLPSLVEGTKHVDPPYGPEDGYHLDRDLADRAISWIRTQRSVAPDKPFFLYHAPGSAHAPHQAPEEWLATFRGKFDHGWDVQRELTHREQIEAGVVPPGTVLTPRPAEIPAWDSLSGDEKALACRLQEAYAAMLAHCDHQFGRILDSLEEVGAAENTLVMFVAGDNGPAAEATNWGQINKSAAINGHPETVAEQIERLDTVGGVESNGNYPAGWGWAGSTPFQWVKQIASHFGGTRNGMVVSWPREIRDSGRLRRQFHHCVDVVPTILRAAGIEPPSSVNGVPQRPIEGVSMDYSFHDASAPSTHTTQYFEMMGHRAIYHEGWVAGARHRVRLPWQQGLPPVEAPFEDDTWELYHVDEDFSQGVDLAETHPEKLRRMQELWWAEAGRHDVLPLDDRLGARLVGSGRPSTAQDTHFTYVGAFRGIPEGAAPNVKGRSHRVLADLELTAERPDGVILAIGGRFGGYTLFFRDGYLHYVHNFVGRERYTVSSERPVSAVGAVRVGFEFCADEPVAGTGGRLDLSIDDDVVASGRVERTVPFSYSTSESLDIGSDTGTPVDSSYSSPFRFNGTVRMVRYEILG